MTRGKTISDAALLDRLLGLITETGPAGMTFAAAAKVAALSPATLVQRFGTRDGLVEAILLRAWDRLDAETAAADAAASLDPTGAVELLLRLTPSSDVDYAVTDGLLLLREDIRNPALRARGAAWGAYLAKALGLRLARHGEDAERLAWQMASVWQGALIWWAFTRDGDPKTKIAGLLHDWCRSVRAAERAASPETCG